MSDLDNKLRKSIYDLIKYTLECWPDSDKVFDYASQITITEIKQAFFDEAIKRASGIKEQNK